MTAFLLTFIAVILTGFGARDQATVATLSERQGPRPMLLAAGAVVSILTAAFAGWAASFVIPMLNSPARAFMAAIALGLAGLELLILGPRRKPEEPTLSLGAAGIVILAHQATDAARFLIFAIAIAYAAPIQAGLGGAAGGVASLAAGWLAPAMVADKRLRVVRMVIGIVLTLLAFWIGLEATG